MYKPFFPNTEFAWSYLAILVGFLVVAAYVDWRRMVIPKWLTLSLLATGAVVSIARGAWLAAHGEKLWLLESGSWWLGAIDGFLFALAGMVAGFLMIFVMWVLSACGGGDVKLFAALGTWLGPIYPVYVLAASLLVLIIVMAGKFVVSGKPPRVPARNKVKQGEQPQKPPKWRVTYSFPVAVATTLVLLWFFRFDLKLAERPTSGQQEVNRVQ